MAPTLDPMSQKSNLQQLFTSHVNDLYSRDLKVTLDLGFTTILSAISSAMIRPVYFAQ